MINPPNLINANTSVGSMMSSMVSSSPSLSAAWSYASNKTAGNMQASTWGQSIDLAKLPAWSHEYVMENVLYVTPLSAATQPH